MTTHDSRPIRRFFKRLFARNRAARIEYRTTPMTDRQREAFDAAFAHMDRAFAELKKGFKP